MGPLAHNDRLAERSCTVSKSTRPHHPHVVGVARRMRMKQPTLQARAAIRYQFLAAKLRVGGTVRDLVHPASGLCVRRRG